jgi:hypothetical protein
MNDLGTIAPRSLFIGTLARDLPITETIDGVIVHHPNRQDVGISDSRADDWRIPGRRRSSRPKRLKHPAVIPIGD